MGKSRNQSSDGLKERRKGPKDGQETRYRGWVINKAGRQWRVQDAVRGMARLERCCQVDLDQCPVPSGRCAIFDAGNAVTTD